MGFVNFPSPTPVFPLLPSEAWSSHKEPSFLTETAVAISGREYQLARQVYPRWLFTLTFGGDAWLREQTQNITPEPPVGYTEWQQLCGLFLQCLGAYGEFFYTDPDDNSRFNVPCGITDGGSFQYPLYYSWGVGPFTPPMTIPVGGVKTLDAVYLNNVPVNPANYALDSTRTLLQFNFIPTIGQTLSVDLHFYFRCRFLEDAELYEQWAKNLWENKELKFWSVKP